MFRNSACCNYVQPYPSFTSSHLPPVLSVRFNGHTAARISSYGIFRSFYITCRRGEDREGRPDGDRGADEGADGDGGAGEAQDRDGDLCLCILINIS